MTLGASVHRATNATREATHATDTTVTVSPENGEMRREPVAPVHNSKYEV
jgi:hypothetical protein